MLTESADQNIEDEMFMYVCVCVRLAFGDLKAAFYWLVFFLLKETYYTHF